MVFRSHRQWRRPKPHTSPKPGGADRSRPNRPPIRINLATIQSLQWPPVEQQFAGIYDSQLRFLDR